MVDVVKPAGVDPNSFSAAVRRLNESAVVRVERRDKGKPADNYYCIWDDGVAPVPTTQDVVTAANAYESSKSQEENNRSDAVNKLVNNATAIRSAMQSVSNASSALDNITPVDSSTLTTLANTLGQRQAAIMFLASNALRAVCVLAKRGELPDNIIDEFI